MARFSPPAPQNGKEKGGLRYYAANPSDKPVIGKMREFCAKHGGLLSFQPDGAGGQIWLPQVRGCGNMGGREGGLAGSKTNFGIGLGCAQVCCSFLRRACTQASDHQGFLHLKPPPGAVHCSYGKKCKFGHWVQIEAQSGMPPQLRSKQPKPSKVGGNVFIAANLALSHWLNQPLFCPLSFVHFRMCAGNLFFLQSDPSRGLCISVVAP